MPRACSLPSKGTSIFLNVSALLLLSHPSRSSTSQGELRRATGVDFHIVLDYTVSHIIVVGARNTQSLRRGRYEVFVKVCTITFGMTPEHDVGACGRSVWASVLDSRFGMIHASLCDPNAKESSIFELAP